ncbi:MAG: hypothetical protein QM714_18685 [Nocardioides sp.]
MGRPDEPLEASGSFEPPGPVPGRPADLARIVDWTATEPLLCDP